MLLSWEGQLVLQGSWTSIDTSAVVVLPLHRAPDVCVALHSCPGAGR